MEVEKKKMSLEEMEADSYKRMVESGKCFHYKARAECFPDVINAFNLMIERGHKCIKVNIQSLMFGDTYIDFWTTTPISDLQRLWDDEGIDLHRLSKTIVEAMD